MPIIVPPTATTDSPITVSDVADGTIQEVQNAFSASGSSSVLISYVDRIQREIVRRRRWDWMKSATQQFVTSLGQTQYWIGATGGASTGQVDTGLNLTDVYEIAASTVLDRNGFTDLAQFEEPPLVPGEENRDTTYIMDSPRWFRMDEGTPNLLEIYPSPMKAPDYLLFPLPPLCGTAVSGALAARTYFVKVTFVDSLGGESTGPVQATQISIPANSVLVVHPPQPGVTTSGTGVSYNRYKVYVSTTEGSELLQSTSVSTTSTWQEPNGGLIAGVGVPTSSTLSPLNGFIIQFRYFKKITRLTSLSDSLLIPPRYIDVVIAGVNWLGAQYNPADGRGSKKMTDWFAVYNSGVVSMIRDTNPFPGTELFIRPDVDTRQPRLRSY